MSDYNPSDFVSYTDALAAAQTEEEYKAAKEHWVKNAMAENEPDETTHKINESADKITLTTKVKRGGGTRDQDTVKVKCKGNNPESTAEKLATTLEALDEHGVTDTLRATQPGDSDD